MKSRSLAILAIMTLVIVGAAAVVMRRPSAGQGFSPTDKLFPNLLSRVNDIEAVRIESGDSSIELARSEGGWVASSHDNYPALYEPIKQLILGIANLTVSEKKTDDPALWDRVGLQDPQPSAPSIRVTLSGQEGSALASLIVGSSAPTGGRFVRKSDESQVWLVSDRLDPRASITSWVSRELLRLNQDEFERITIAHENGSSVSIVSSASEGSGFQLQAIPEGRELKTPTELNRIASLLAYLDFDSVRAAGGAEEEPADIVLTSIEFSSGATLTIRTWREGALMWCSVAAVGGVTDGPDAPSETPQADESESAADFAKRMNDVHVPWEYSISPARAAPLRSTIEELTKPIESAPTGE